jgi:broad specificity phosphatase PhoE
VTRLLIWRHGRTAWNAEGRFQGQTDVDLDDLGRRQALAAARVLAGTRPGAIITSDLRRAADTAAALAELTGLSVLPDARLRERHFGRWQGMSGTEVAATFPVEYAAWRRGDPSPGCGIEHVDDAAKRVAAGVADAVARAEGGTVVVATHGGSARYALGELLGWSRTVTARIGGLGNCHWSELHSYPDRGWLLVAHNVGPDAAAGEPLAPE